MEDNNREYTNGEITVFWRPKECIHATTCFRELRSVFDPAKRPWVNMKGASTAEIIRIVDLCPTNALTYKWNKDIETAKNLRQENGLGEKPAVPVENQTSSHTPTPTVEIRVLPDGPLVVKGDFITIGSDGKELRKMKISTFCRCGRSLNMPYCDGTHRKVGFSSK